MWALKSRSWEARGHQYLMDRGCWGVVQQGSREEKPTSAAVG